MISAYTDQLAAFLHLAVPIALALASATIGLDVVLVPDVGWTTWLAWLVVVLFAWFMGLVLRRQVVLLADLRLLRARLQVDSAPGAGTRVRADVPR